MVKLRDAIYHEVKILSKQSIVLEMLRNFIQALTPFRVRNYLSPSSIHAKAFSQTFQSEMAIAMIAPAVLLED